MKFSSLEVLRVPGRERRAERDTGVQTPREKQTLQASEEEGGVGGNSRSKLRNPASLGWAAGRPGPLGGCWEDTGVRQRHRSGLFHGSNIFNAGVERGAHPALTRDSGSAVGCEHSHLGRGPMGWTRGTLLPGLPDPGQTSWVLPVVPGLVDYK